MQFRKHAEVEALAQAELARLGRSTGKPLPMSNWVPVIHNGKPKPDGKGKRKANRHRGHRNQMTGHKGKGAK